MTTWSRTEVSRYGERWEVTVTPEKGVTMVKKRPQGTMRLRSIKVVVSRVKKGSVRVTIGGLTLIPRGTERRGTTEHSQGVDGFPWEGNETLVIEASPTAVEKVIVVGDVDSERGEG